MRRTVFGRNKVKVPVDYFLKYDLNGNLLDSSGNGYNGGAPFAFTGKTVPSYTTGRKAGIQCAYFNGNNAFKSPTFSLYTNVSLSFWIKTNANGNLFTNASHYLYQQGVLFSISGGYLRLNYKNTNIKTSSKLITDNEWHHVVFIYRTGVGGNLGLEIWVDGVNTTVNTATNANITNQFRGSDGYSFGTGNELGGSFIFYMGEIRMYNRSILPTEIDALYKL